MDPCIIDYSIEIPARCSFVIEFVIPKFLKDQHVSSGPTLIIRSSKLYLQHIAHSALATASHHMGCKYSLELLMMSGMPFGTR
jgi:hypothetical protein